MARWNMETGGLALALALLVSWGAPTAHAQTLLGDVVRPAPVTAPVAAKTTRLEAGLEPVQATTVRSRAIGIEREVIRTATRAVEAWRTTVPSGQLNKTTPAVQLQLSFFSDAAFAVELTGSERTQSGGQALVGRVAGDPLSSVILVDNGGEVYFALAQQGKKYLIHGSAERGYTADQLQADAPLPGSGTNDAVPVPKRVIPSVTKGASSQLSAAQAGAANTTSASNNGKSTTSPVAGRTLAADDGSMIDLMVIYTPAAMAAVGGAAQIEAMIDSQVAYTNLIYQNSEVVQRLRLVYKGKVAYTERDPFVDLMAINLPTDGFADEIPILRDVFHADVVSVWGQYPTLCGVANLGDPENIYNGDFPVSLVNAPNCTGPGDMSMAHELGHLMGLQHDIGTLGFNPFSHVTPEGGGAMTQIDYAHGYVDSVNRFRDAMAYDTCFAANPAVQCPRIPYFSNPTLLYDNHAYYSGAVAAPLGRLPDADAHQALNDTRDTIAAYRPELTNAALAGPGFVTFTDRFLRVAEGGGSVTATVRRLGTAGAVSVNYATAPVTATDGADYTGTFGTLTWADGDNSTRTITVPILQDSLLEGDEIFNIVLGGATGGVTIGGYNGVGSSVRIIITDDEPDTFPVGTSLPAGFTTTTGQEWTVDTTHGYLSPASLRSAQAHVPLDGSVGSLNSDLVYTGTFGTGNVSFVYMVASGAAPYSVATFEFSIDGVVQAQATGGIFNWTSVSTFISAGTHTLRWRFTNTSNGNCLDYGAFDYQCDDRAYIDALVMPQVTPSTPVSRYAYIANNNGASVSVIDLVSNTVTATIPVGSGPAGAAVHPDGTRVYVANSLSNTLSVIDVFTQTVMATIPVSSTPFGVAVSPDGTRVYVTQYNGGMLSVINTATNTLVQNIPTTSHGYLIALNPAGTKAFITGDSKVRIVDLVNVTSQDFTTGYPGIGVAVSPDGTQYTVVMNADHRAITYDSATNAVVRQDNLAGQPLGVAYNPSTGRVYYTTGNSLMAFSTLVGDVGVATAVGTIPYGVAVSLDGARIYTANPGSNNVSVLDATNYATIATIPVGSYPQSPGFFISRTSRPAPPRAPAVAPGDSQALLSFTVPVDNGGHAITQYNATCQPGSITAVAASSPILVTGLTNNTAYTCSVTASNVRGASDASAAISVTPGTASYITSTTQATFTVLSASAFNITTSGLPVTSVTATGTLPAGITLNSSGLLFGTPLSGSAGVYPLALTAANGVGAPGTQSFTLTIARIAQNLNFPVIADRSPTSGAFTLTITGGASGQPITVTSSTPAVCTISGMTVTLVSSGTCTLAANQGGATDYSAATQVTRSFLIRNGQTIAVSNAPANLMYNATFTLSATGGGSGNAVVFSSATPAVCTTSGTNGAVITGVTQGTCTVNANQAGNASYDAATQVSVSFPIVIATQVITYSTAPLQIGAASTVITNSIGPNQPPVVLVTSTPVNCTVSGAQVTALQFAPCQLSATQAGNANYLAATPVAFTLQAFATMNSVRGQHTATVLNDGRILVAGGGTAGIMFATAEIYDPATSRWTATGSMASARKQHTATLLTDGRVLVTGGLTTGSALATAEIYNPAAGTWSSAGAFSSGFARMQHSATRMNDGRVLVAGGNDTTTFVPTATVEIYDPTTNTWSAGPVLPGGNRFDHAAVLLQDGRVMLFGGSFNSNSGFNSTLIYDPVANSWTNGAAMGAARNQPTATVLADGRVLVVGGGPLPASPSPSAERYDPVANTWTGAGSLATPVYGLTATLLANGRVLAAGGANGVNASTVINTTALYDPTSNAWTTAKPMLSSRYTHTGSLLADGSVILVGGKTNPNSSLNTSEAYFPELTLFSVTFADVEVGTTLPVLPLSVGGGIGPYTFAVTAGTLPPGTALTTAGVYSGTVTTGGSYNFTVTATDTGNGNGNATATRSYSMLVGYIVTPSLTGDGSIAPATPAVYAPGSTPTFTITKNIVGNGITVAGTCGGTLAGTVYTVAPITASCTVNATLGAGPPFAPAFVGTATAGNAQATFGFGASTNDGGSPILSYLATSSPGGVTGSCTAPCSFITVTGLTNGTTYTFTVAGVNAIGAGASSSPTNSVTPQGTQTIVFGTVPTINVGDTVTINVTGGASGNPVVLTTPSTTCSISGLSVTALSAGVCSLRANQAGNTAYKAAAQALKSVAIAGLRTITPSVASGAGTISPSTPVAAANGATVTFTVTPDSGYTAAVSGTCGGNLVGTTFTTNIIAANCTVIATFTLIPTTVPGAPTIGTATAGNNQAAIAFTAPASDGGSPITGYTATCNAGAFTAIGTVSPIAVTGLSNGTAYTCSVTAANAVGSGAASGTVGVTPTSGVGLSAVQSRKTHGTAGDFDLAIDTTPLIDGAVTVEPRVIGAGHRIVFQFDRAVATVGSVATLDINGNPIGTATSAISGNEVTVTLTSVADISRVTVLVNGVNGTLSVSASIGFLVGDVNNSRTVNASDISGVKARSGVSIDATNFKYDLNISGAINTSDISAVKARSGNSL